MTWAVARRTQTHQSKFKMNVVKVHQTVKLSLPVADHEYSGEEDKCRIRTGSGTESWKKEEWQQTYTGQFLHDCIHNYGEYIWRNIDVNQHEAYEGKFYTNNLEGYGKFSYKDGQTFEGLFENNNRFGPGILTYADGTEDVGLWIGQHLVRLNQSPTSEVPSIANTVKGKAYLLNYKNLVRVQEKKDDPALEILKALNANETALRRKNELYSKYVRNSKSTFFNKKLYDDSYFTNNDDWIIDVIDTYDSTGAPILSKVLVTHLIAWNNEKLAVKIMRHTFKHRNLETNLSFNISKVFTGERGFFRPPGRQELLCLEFLQSCCDQNDHIIIKLICNNDLYPDLTDYLGNNGVMYAAVHDCCKIIKTLTNYGANVDNMNDECLTALIISILRFIVYKYDVTNWELAFLPSEVESIDFKPHTQTWRTIEKKNSAEFQNGQVYLFDLSCKKSKDSETNKHILKYDTKSNSTARSKHESRANSKPDSTQDSTKRESLCLKQLYLDKILRTIICLLNCGSKPNYGDCPFPPLILAIFARSPEIVENLLQHGADINIRTADHIGSLTPLHIVASLPAGFELTPLARTLMIHGANPNLISNNTHWTHENHDILAGSKLEVHGKTPLQLLCMRYDFVEDYDDYLGSLCSLLINLGAEPNAQYLGHTPLTLALLRGNTRLMSRILDTGFVNPNQSLGNNMGSPLTVLILKRYQNILPPVVCKQIYATLLDFYANPLDDVPNFSANSVEFCEEENKIEIATPFPFSRNTKVKPGKASARKNQQQIDMLKDAALSTLLKRIYKKVVQNIYQYHIECGFNHPIFDAIVKYLNLDITENYLQLLLDHDLIFPSKTMCYLLLEFVEMNVPQKPQKGKKKPRTIEHMIYDLDFDKTAIREKKFHFIIHPPELDPDEIKFKVCFECFKRRDKTLVRCPICQMVYFCSQECNIKNYYRKNSKHPCKLIFYNDELLNEEDSLFDQFQAQREKMIADDPDYFKKLRQNDTKFTDSKKSKPEHRQLEKDKTAKSQKPKSRRDASKESKKKAKAGKVQKRGKSPKSPKSGKSGKQSKPDKGKKGDKAVSPVRQERQGRPDVVVPSRDSSPSRLQGALTDTFFDTVSDICINLYDERYFAMFMPYCVFVNGQLYYKFDNCTSFDKMTFSNV